MWFIGVEVEQETSAPLPKKNPASAPAERQTRSDSIPSEHRKLAYDSWSSPGISRPTGNKKDIIRKRVAVRTYTCHGNQVLEKTD